MLFIISTVFFWVYTLQLTPPNFFYLAMVRPIPCCKVDSSLALTDSTCPTTSSSTKQNDSTGCKTVIRSYITTSADVIMYVSFGVLAFLVSSILTFKRFFSFIFYYDLSFLFAQLTLFDLHISV